MLKTLTCENCGKEFIRDTRNLHKDSKYCSRKCYHAAKIGTTRPDLWKRTEKVCPVCGRTFITGGRAGNVRQVTCSDECQRASRYRHGMRANQLSPVDAAYIAGFVDGEGSILLTTRKGKAGLKMTVANTNRAIMDWLVSTVGVGSLSNHTKASERNKAGWLWQFNSEAAESLLIQILPYLHIKVEQAKLGLETQEKLRDPKLNSDRSWQMENIEKMHKLNARAGSKYFVTGD
jgi:hypothetical protein